MKMNQSLLNGTYLIEEGSKKTGLSTDDARFRITPYQQMAASCSGALITSLFMTPLDVVKIRLQAQQKALLSNKCFLYCNGLMDHICQCGPGTDWFPKREHFNGTIDAFMKITRTEGVKALWSGLGPTLILAVPCTVIYFVSYEQLRVRIKDRYTASTGKLEQPVWIPLISGVSARVTAVTIVSPLELVRTKMQSQKLSYTELYSALSDVIKYKGFIGLWRGLSSTLLRDVPFSGIYWSAYETFKKSFGSTSNTNSFAFNFCAGATSGCIAALITLPFDVIKTHQQIELGEKEIYANGSVPGRRALGAVGMLRRVYEARGAAGVCAGLLPRLCKVAPACAIMIASFEYGKTFFQNYNMQEYHKNERRKRCEDL